MLCPAASRQLRRPLHPSPRFPHPQWGNDFRPDYKRLSLIKQQFPNTPIIALVRPQTGGERAALASRQEGGAQVCAVGDPDSRASGGAERGTPSKPPGRLPN